MTRRSILAACSALSVSAAALLTTGALPASAKLIKMPTIKKEARLQRRAEARGALQPPPLPCPQNGTAPCGIPEAVATTLPWPGNMAYYGGHVQTTPHIYLVYWGWGEKGAFPASQKCTSEKLVEGTITATLRCDPDGAGQYMANFVNQLGGTQWAGEQTKYYQTVTDPAGNSYNQHIDNPSDQLGGIWVDDTNSITGLPKTSGSNPAGPTNT